MMRINLHLSLRSLLPLGMLLLATTFVACDDDFSPNSDWKEIPTVYCLLDQDDDTIFVRLQRCYLGDGNLYNYSTISDSIYYPAGEVEVVVRVWRSEAEMADANATPLRELAFDRILYHKDDGLFASGRQPVYVHPVAAGDMDTAYTYELLVRRVATGEVMASSSTRLLGNPDERYGWLKTPSRIGSNGRVTFNMLSGSCLISWYPLKRGRLYQPSIRMYFRYRFDRDSLRYIDIPCDAVKQTNENSIELNTSVYREHYLGEVAKLLASDTNHKVFVDTVGIMLNVANEPFNAYIASTSSVGSQDYRLYNNIQGGIGLFAARRSHLFELVLSDKGDQPTGLHTLLEQLGVGFQQSDL